MRINGQLPVPAKFPGNQQRLIVGALAKSKGMERDRDEKVGSPIGGNALPGSIKEVSEGAIESKTAVELEAMDSVT
jgi:hypothetical protein